METFEDFYFWQNGRLKNPLWQVPLQEWRISSPPSGGAQSSQPPALSSLWELPHVRRANLVKTTLFQRQLHPMTENPTQRYKGPASSPWGRLNSGNPTGWLRPSLGLHCSSISPPAQSYSFSLLQVLIDQGAPQNRLVHLEKVKSHRRTRSPGCMNRIVVHTERPPLSSI